VLSTSQATTGVQAMTQGNTILFQLRHLVPQSLFESLTVRHQVNRSVRKMTGSAHFVVMLFAQFAGLPSLRLIEQATTALTPAQRRSGLIRTCRSTLAEANLRIPRMFYNYSELLLLLCKKMEY